MKFLGLEVKVLKTDIIPPGVAFMVDANTIISNLSAEELTEKLRTGKIMKIVFEMPNEENQNHS